MNLHWQILLALVLAVIAGQFTGMDAAVLGVRFYDVYTFLGTLFMNALKMLIVPLIMSSIITGMAGIGDSDAMGRLGGKTLLYY
ncbi:MAG TPA: cation:dicarboxylase symporter family transporter, partial [Gammaproteobacteria bacterium]|nr:cation:dicarboxylase symporter family transporter [Gammaproteobacteria bacterium]